MRKISSGLSLFVLLFSLHCTETRLTTEVFFNENFEDDKYLEAIPEEYLEYCAPNTDKHFCGERSLMVSVTLNSDSKPNWVWYNLPKRIPCEGKLNISARILIETITHSDPDVDTKVGLGVNFEYDPTTHSGCGPIHNYTEVTDGWERQEADLVSWGAQNADQVIRSWVADATGENVGVYVTSIGIAITGSPNSTVVVYLDAIQIVGKVPKSENYAIEATERFEPVEEKFENYITLSQMLLDSYYDGVEDLDVVSGVEDLKTAAKDSITNIRTTFDDLETKGAGLIKPRDMRNAKSRFEPTKYVISNLKKVSEATADSKIIVTFVPKPTISNSKILPKTFLIPAAISNEIEMDACKGEFEPTSFAVYGLQDINNIVIETTELRNGDHVIPVDSVDIHVVKCWYQAGVDAYRYIADERILTPELLLKNDDLVEYNFVNRTNTLLVKDEFDEIKPIDISGEVTESFENYKFEDTEELRPVDICAYNAKQFWITIHVPINVFEGSYEGRIELYIGESLIHELSLKLRVLPFELEDPYLRYAIYYSGCLTDDDSNPIDSGNKSEEQYELEMYNLKKHGIEYPTTYQQYDEEKLNNALAIRNRIYGPFSGLRHLYTLGVVLDPIPESSSEIAELKDNVNKWLEIANDNNYGNVFFYGQDEAKGDELFKQRAAWIAIKDTGGKIFATASIGAFELMGCLYDHAIEGGEPNREEARKFHEARSKILCYGNPQTSNEEPETFRRNYGLLLWKARYDGAMPFAYQYGFGNIWNDFDDPKKEWRDHAFAYPTTNGVINTIQWEGFREGVDDIRYLTTLINDIEEIEECNPELAAEAKWWLDDLNPSGNLQRKRMKIVDWILKIRSEIE